MYQVNAHALAPLPLPNTNHLVSSFKLSTVSRAFPVAAAKIWNVLMPDDVVLVGAGTSRWMHRLVPAPTENISVSATLILLALVHLVVLN